MTSFPLRYARGNLILAPTGQAAGLYRLRMVSYPFLPLSGKRRLAGGLERFTQTVAADFSLWRVSRAYPADHYPRQTRALLDERHQNAEAWEAFLKGHKHRLGQLGSHLPEAYLAIALPADRPTRLGSGLIRSLDQVRRRVEDLAGVGTPTPISAGELQRLAAAEQRTYERLTGVLPARRATTAELQWLLRRVSGRGVGEPAGDRFWQPDALMIEAPGGVAYEPLEQDLWRCANAAITERERSLIVDSEDGRSHQAMLAVGSLADSPLFPGAGSELLFAPLEAVSFPVDAVLHARWIGNRQALGQVRKRIADVEHAYHEQIAGSAHGPGLLAAEDRMLAREYEATLQSGAHPPMLYASISLAVGARTGEELERRVSALREQYGDVSLHRPAGLQHRLFQDHLPRPDGGQVSDYRQQLTVKQLGALVPTATRAVGSGSGPYLGFVPSGSPRPVRFDSTAAPRESRASAVLLTGTLGSGKTVAAELIAYAAERRGSLVVDFDPKPDHGWENLPELEGRLEVLELSGDPGQQGRLDPLQIGLPEMREELACSYLLELLHDPPASWENAISKAVKQLVHQGSRQLAQIVPLLKAGESTAAREAGEALEVICDFGLARLGFATDDRQPTIRAQRALTTIRTPGLTLPDPRASRETYTRAERVSVATLSLIAAYALWLISGDRSRHKLVLLDEAWFLLASTQGRQVINRLVLMGRAFNATILLASQRLAHLGDLAELIGIYLIFGQESDLEAARALELIGLNAKDEGLVGLVRSFRQGRCLMRDLDGRVGEVQIDTVYPHLLAALNTSPAQSGSVRS
jgi:AAA-like domain